MKAARKRRGMTQAQLAQLSTVSVRTLRDLELDLTRQPRQDTVRLLLDNLRLTNQQRAEIESAAGGFPGLNLCDASVPPPAAVKRIIGRDRDVSALTALLKSGAQRLVQVRGVAGVGKTRLLQEVATTIHATLDMPIVWTGQESPTDPPQGLARLLAAVLRGEQGSDEAVARIGVNRVLLIVTAHEVPVQTEHLLGLLERCPELRIVHETRDTAPRPDAADYLVLPLQGLDRPVGDASAVDAGRHPALHLLLSRCPAPYGESPGEVRALVRLCRQLDGIPRALESAAAWLSLYPPSELLDLVERDPFTVAVPVGGAAGGLWQAFVKLAASLPAADAVPLGALAGIAEPWTVEEALSVLASAGQLDGHARIYRLWASGLLRPVDGDHGRAVVEPDRRRFTVLNLVRHALAWPGTWEPAAARHR